ncbi:MAG: hypothetical protein JWP80_3987 [Pseudomonas sp.]|nr:hypothetical protein [Pseudomonas sp.]
MSGKPAGRKGDAVTCPKCGLTMIDTGSPDVLFDGLAAARQTDCTACGSELNAQVIPNVLINGKAAVVVGSQGSHGGVVIGGSGTVLIGSDFTSDSSWQGPTTVSGARSANPLPPQLPKRVVPWEERNHDLVAEELEEEEEEVEIDDETPVRITLRIGVFFDGTLNNATNTAMGMLCGAHHAITPEDLHASCQPYMADPDSSYGNDLSNVAKLNDLYYAPEKLQPGKQGKLAFRKIYVDGIGSVLGEEDDKTGAGLGRGETGVAGRVESAFDEIGRLIRNIYKKDANNQITGVIFDTFGFSRGAAAARHFATEVARGQRGPLKNVLNNNRAAFSRTFTGDYQRGFDMGFIGLFDTVAAIGGLYNLLNISSGHTPWVDIALPKQLFRDVVQLVARDECRYNFALNKVGPEHPEIIVPGVHSDVGGGYRAEADESVLVIPMQGLTVAANCDVKTTSIYREAEQARLQMIANGWPAEALEIVTPPSLELPPDPQDRMAPRQKRVFASLQIKRTVRGELSRVYLRVMYELAKQKQVIFREFKEQDSNHVLPPELQPLCDRFLAGDYRITPTEDVLLKKRYIHTSASWNNPMTGKDGEGLDLLYFNSPTADGVRVLHPHTVRGGQ